MAGSERRQPNGDTQVRPAWRQRLVSATVGLLIVAGSLGLGAYTVSRWIEKQVLDVDNWVALVSPLPKQEVVATALGSHISNQVFASVPVEQKIAEALPPRAEFLAGPLASQLQTITTSAAQKLVASDGFQSLWTAANRLAMERLVSTARGETPPLQAKVNERFDINLAEIAGQLRSRLGNASQALPSLEAGSTAAINISADLRAKGDRIRQFIRTTDYLAAVLPAFAIASLLGALALSRQRRKTTLAIAVSIIVVGLLELIALKWLRQEVASQVRVADNLPAITYIFDTLTAWFRQMVYVVILLATLLAAICLAAGPAGWAVALRSYVNIARAARSRPMQQWHLLRQWTAQHRNYLWLAAAVLVLAYVALAVTVTAQAIIIALLLILSLVAAIHIIATPRVAGPAASQADV